MRVGEDLRMRERVEIGRRHVDLIARHAAGHLMPQLQALAQDVHRPQVLAGLELQRDASHVPRGQRRRPRHRHRGARHCAAHRAAGRGGQRGRRGRQGAGGAQGAARRGEGGGRRGGHGLRRHDQRFIQIPWRFPLDFHSISIRFHLIS